MHELTSSLDFGAVYEAHYELLVAIAMDRFDVPEVDAETLAQEVLLSFLRSGSEVTERELWLVAGICSASRFYAARA
jgi:DNA-directed RNA polymerase specialized sigma24 family protein